MAKFGQQTQMPGSVRLPVVYLVRHGETPWTITGQHTSVTDLPLTPRGEDQARLIGAKLALLRVTKIFTSPLRRTTRTCELAGFLDRAEMDPDLGEWRYGAYEGRRTADIVAERPGWDLFRDGCPGGESPEEVAARADRVVDRVRGITDDVLMFSSGHFLRVFAARWLGLQPAAGRYWILNPASLSALGYEHGEGDPVIRVWNETYDPK